MLLDANPVYDAKIPATAGQFSYAPRRDKALEKGYIRVVTTSGQRADQQGSSAAAPDFAALMVLVRDAGDRAAFGQIFQHFAPRVKGFLMKSGTDAALAEELAQDVMTTVWHKSAQFDPARASLATWIFTIARNRRIDYFRRTRRPEPEDLDWGPDTSPDQADVYETAQEARQLAAALETLPAPQRDLIQRAFFGDLSHGEIAAQTGLPLGTIKSRIRLALERLRQNLK